MAGIGLYGVYYSKAKIENGILTGYSGVKQMGKAISANFEPEETEDNPLYANNGVAETDAKASSGGDLTLVLDKLVAEARKDIFGLTKKTVKVEIDGEEVTGEGFDDTGDEEAAPVGVGFIRQKQENQNRNLHEAVIYSYCTFSQPSEEYETMEEDIDWQTPELEAKVSGASVTGSYPWRKRYTFPSLEAAIKYIETVFAETGDNGGGE